MSVVSLSLVGCAVGSGDPSSEPSAKSGDEITGSAASRDFAIDGCAERWQDAADYVGIVGTYARDPLTVAPLGEIISVTFESAVAQSRSIETRGYDMRRDARRCFTYGCDTAFGSYVAVPVNPAIGSWIFFGNARYIDTRAESDLEASYAVAGVRKSASGAIGALCVVKYAQGSASSKPFVLARVGF
jgi:hypothetical protein